MALDLGELEATIAVDDQQFESGLDQAEGRFGKWGDKLQMAAAAAGVVIAGALTMALAEAMELDSAQAELEAALGDEQYAKDLGKVAGHMYTEGWGESVKDNMDAIRAILGSGLLAEDATDEQIEKTTTAAQALAQVFGQDVAAAARAAGQMVRNGLAKDSTEALDILTRGFQQTGDPAGDLLDTFSEYSVQFRKLGIDGTTAMGLLSQGIKGGARDLDIVADAFKEFSIRSIDGSKASAEGYKALGLDAEKMTAIFAKGGPEAAAAMDLVLDKLKGIKDPAAQAAAATGLFGTQSEDLGAALYSLDMDTAAEGMGNVAGASEKMAGALGGSASAQMESFKRKVKEAIVEQVAKAVPLLEDMFEWGNKNKEWIGPVVATLGTLAAVIGTIVAITKVYTAVQAALNIVMMMNPIGLIILGIIALVAGFLLLYNKVSWFRDAVDAVFAWIVAAAKLWWDVFSGFWSTIGEWFVKLFKGWWELFTGFWGGVFEAVGAAWDWIVEKWNAMIKFIKSIPGKIGAAASGMWDGIKNAFRSAINWIISKWNGLSLRLPSVDLPFIGRVGGFTLRTAQIPYLNVGGDITKTGVAVVHQGERVLTAAQAERVRGNGGGIHRLIIEGTGLLSGLRDEISLQGGDVQTVLGGAP